jgi:hypothetical protein
MPEPRFVYDTEDFLLESDYLTVARPRMGTSAQMIFVRIAAACLCLFVLSQAVPGVWNSVAAIVTHLRGDILENVIELPEGWTETATAYPRRSGTPASVPKRSIYCGKNNGESIAVLGPPKDGKSIRFAVRTKEFDHSYSQTAGIPSKAYLGGSSVLAIYLMNLVVGILAILISIFILAWLIPDRRTPA